MRKGFIKQATQKIFILVFIREIGLEYEFVDLKVTNFPIQLINLNLFYIT